METLNPTAVIESFGLSYFRELSTFGALSDEAIKNLLTHGSINRLEKGEVVYKWGAKITGFRVVLQGDLAFYKHCEGHDVLTRHFISGEEASFDGMIGLMPHSGTAVAVETSLVLKISHEQFYNLHTDFPADFGLLMINLAREQAREIAMLEEVIGKSTGWSIESAQR